MVNVVNMYPIDMNLTTARLVSLNNCMDIKHTQKEEITHLFLMIDFYSLRVRRKQ